MRQDKIQVTEWGLEEHPSIELLRQYEEGVLPPATNYELERHLLDCEMCADILIGMSLSDRRRTQQVRSRIWQRIRTRIRRKHRPRALLGLADWRVALGVLMMFCSLGLLLFYHYTQTATSQQVALQANEVQPPSPEELLARTIDAALVLDIPAAPNQRLETGAAGATVQTESGLSGQLVLPDGQGAGQVKIQVQGSPLSTYTDTAGNFSLQLAAGSYTLLISGAGFPAQTHEVTSPARHMTVQLMGQ